VCELSVTYRDGLRHRTDRETWVVQGWIVTDLDALARMNIPDGETAVEIPDRMIKFFSQEDRDTGNR
jgi:hypothetical protein